MRHIRAKFVSAYLYLAGLILLIGIVIGFSDLLMALKLNLVVMGTNIVAFYIIHLQKIAINYLFRAENSLFLHSMKIKENKQFVVYTAKTSRLAMKIIHALKWDRLEHEKAYGKKYWN